MLKKPDLLYETIFESQSTSKKKKIYKYLNRYKNCFIKIVNIYWYSPKHITTDLEWSTLANIPTPLP